MIKKLFFFSISAVLSFSNTYSYEDKTKEELQGQIRKLTQELETERRNKQNFNISINNSPSNEVKSVTYNHVISSQLMLQLVKEKAEEAKNFITKNKAKLTLSTVATAYGSIVILMIWARATLKRLKWANWHRSDTISEMLSIPHEQLTQQLIFDIQSIYTNVNNPTDIEYPLSQFFIHALKEKKTISFYTSLTNIIKTLKLSRFFPFYQKLVVELHQQEERLNHYINLVTSWVNKEKMNKINNAVPQSRNALNENGDESKNLEIKEKNPLEIKKFFKQFKWQKRFAFMHCTVADCITHFGLQNRSTALANLIDRAYQKEKEIERIRNIFTHNFDMSPGLHLRYDDDNECFMKAHLLGAFSHSTMESNLRQQASLKHHFKPA